MVNREFQAFGSKVIETNQEFTGPENEPDFWEGEKFDTFGTAVQVRWLGGGRLYNKHINALNQSTFCQKSKDAIAFGAATQHQHPARSAKSK